MEAFATLEEDAAFAPGVWIMLLLGGGIVWELARSGAAYWESETRSRQYALTAFLLMWSARCCFPGSWGSRWAGWR